MINRLETDQPPGHQFCPISIYGPNSLTVHIEKPVLISYQLHHEHTAKTIELLVSIIRCAGLFWFVAEVMLFTFSHRLFISLFFTLRICFLLDGDVALIIYTVKSKKKIWLKASNSMCCSVLQNLVSIEILW